MAQRLDGGEAILEALRRLGVDYIISSPGSEWPAVWDALARQALNEQPGPAYLNTWHETLAVAMASGYTRLTGRMQAVLLHAGVGVLQGSMGIHGAWQGEVPMLVCSGETGAYGETPDFDPGPQWLRNLSIPGGPNRLVEAITKWSSRVTSPQTLYETVSRAGELAQRAPRGPAFLNIPMETMREEWRPPAAPKARPPAPRSFPDPAVVAQVAGLLARSSRPVIVADAAGRSNAGFEALVALAETAKLPVYESEGPFCANFPKDHPLHHGYDLPRRLADYDLFLVVGNRAPWYPPSAGPAGAAVVIIDEYPIKEYMAYQDLQADCYLEGDVAASLGALTAALGETGYQRPPSPTQNDAPPQNAGVWETYRRLPDGAADASPIDPAWLCNVLNEVMPPDTVFIDETITHRSRILRRIGWNSPHSYLRPAGGLGQGLGIALGAKLAAPERPVAALVGDGSLLYNPVPQSLGAAQEHRLPILIVVFNNGGYAAMKNLHLSFYPQGTAAQSGKFHGVDIPGPNYAELVAPFGGYGEQVADPRRLPQALQAGLDAVAQGRTAIIDVLLSD